MKKNVRKRVTQADIAQAAGVSQVLVGLALSGKKRMREATREKILTTAKRLGYIPHRSAQLLRGSKSGLIGVLYASCPQRPEIAQTIQEKIRHVAAEVWQNHYKLIVQDISWFEFSVPQAIEMLLQLDVEGILVIGDFSHQELDVFREVPVPLLGLNTGEMENLPVLRSNIEEAMFQMVRHLSKTKVHRILFFCEVSGEESLNAWSWSQRESFLGIQKAAKKLGLTFHCGGMEEYLRRAKAQTRRKSLLYVLFSSAKSSPTSKPPKQNEQTTGETGYHQAETLWTRAPRRLHPDTLICPNDAYAFGVLKFLNTRGVQIPKQIQVTGFDNLAFRDYCFPSLTTIQQNYPALAKKAVTLLTRMIQGHRYSTKLTQISCELLPGNSTRPPRAT